MFLKKFFTHYRDDSIDPRRTAILEKVFAALHVAKG